ncbi:B3 domain-containing protein LOC_Os12g40080-like isoform X2 [Phragmites australis]|uniref:B3 domain-containing protein LOC_Os12g40080-like isoform X2 n=1 Tax=Phragmites australis TaxID=29695 RepID=UPI002D776BFF|nr:B3 domain-containing protein LOC_Os12g40080-like isoform X2 [Phragmites australis]
MASQDHEDDGRSGHKISRNSCQTCSHCDNSFQRCSHCDAHYYWHHLDDRRKHFFKLMVGDFRHEMAVPEKFTNNFRGQISEVVKLEAPDGNMYNVNVSKDLNRLVLRSGWSAFSSAYELKQGDMLVFRYSGDSRFKVLIFDPSGCEKEFFRVVMNTGCSVQQKSIPHDQSPSREGFQQKSIPHEQSPSSEGLARHRTGGLSDTWKASKINPADSPSQRSGIALAEDIPSPEDIQDPLNSGGLQTSTESRFILAKGCNLTRAQNVKNMNKANLSDGFAVISKDYSANYLPHEDQTLKICHPPDFKKRDADGAYIFSPSRSSFFRHNELQEGDVCAFELSRRDRSMTMTVHSLNGSYDPQGASSSEHRVGHPGYMVTKFTNLNQEQKKKIEEKLREIQSETPVFVSVKRRSGASMCFSQDFAVEYLPREAQTMRLRRPGMSCSWEAELQINKVHQLCRGWKQFVDDNALRQGDMCLFQPLDGGEEELLAMNVHIIRGD